MNVKWIKLSIIALLAGLLGFAALTANAQGMGGGQWGMGNDSSLIAVAADALGMEPADLVAELGNGSTIAQLAEDKGVKLETIVDTFMQSHTEWLTGRVASGSLTQERADAMLELMKTQVTNRLSESFTVQGFGAGMGFHMGAGMMPHNGMMMGQGMHGMGRGMGFNDADGNGWCDNCPNLPGTASS